MFAGDDFKISAKASSTLGKPADSVRSDTALVQLDRASTCGIGSHSEKTRTFSFGQAMVDFSRAPHRRRMTAISAYRPVVGPNLNGGNGSRAVSRCREIFCAPISC